MKIRLIFLLVIISSVICPLFAEDWITIYNDDLSLVRSKFELKLPLGKTRYYYDDITSRIEPASVIVAGKGVRIAEQNYEYDLAGKQQIMKKYLDKEVAAIMKDQSTLSGTLKFFDGANLGIIEKNTDRLLVIRDSEVQWLQLASLPSNFYTKPTLAWDLISSKKGTVPLVMSYLSGGFSWDVTYNAVWDGALLDLNSWVTINNYSGKAFEDVNLKLIAGDVNRIRQSYFSKQNLYREEAMYDAAAGMAAPSFEAQTFHDFHMYTLDQKVSFANNQTKQLELYAPHSVKASTVYEYPTFSEGVQSLIRFVNTENQGLGKALPKGTIKVYKKDKDGNLEFIGEDAIKHTSVNEELSVNTGIAFDLLASSQVRNHKSISNKASERDIYINLKNNSKESKRIDIVHHLSANAKIVESELRYNYDPVKNKVTYQVELAAGTERSFYFRERNEW